MKGRASLRRRPLLFLVVAASALPACGSFSGSSPSRATPSARQLKVTPAPFNVGVAVQGAANPADAAFRADQQGLYDSRQFNDSSFYFVGYHWKIDRGIGPHGVRSAHASFDNANNAWVIVIAFTPAPAQRFGADTEAAFQAFQTDPGSPPALSHIALFIGNEVVSAPYVQSPSSNDTEIAGNFTEHQAQDLVRAIAAAAQSY